MVCRDIIEDKLSDERKMYYSEYGKDVSEFFEDAYNFRSKFLQEGMSPVEKLIALNQ